MTRYIKVYFGGIYGVRVYYCPPKNENLESFFAKNAESSVSETSIRVFF